MQTCGSSEPSAARERSHDPGHAAGAGLLSGSLRGSWRCGCDGAGSAYITEDLDICYDAAEDSFSALIALINYWNPRPRMRVAGGPFFPLDEEALRELLAVTLETDHGAIDLLREVKGVGAYAECKAESVLVSVGSLEFAVLTLPALIRAKRATGSRKHQEALLELEALADLARQRTERATPTG